MKDKGTLTGHLLAIFAVVVWGTTFVSTKVLLKSFSAYEIIIFRVFLAYIVLFLIRPKLYKFAGIKKELLYFAAAVTGVSVYQVMENLALECAYASTTSVVIAAAPMFTAVFAALAFKDEKLHWNFFVGFVISMAGVSLVSLKSSDIGFSLKGTLLALAASALWGVYSVICRKMNSPKDDMVLVTRRIFLYGGITMIPMYFIFDCKIGLERFAKTENLLNMIYLGVIASALCFIAWNTAVKKAGVITTGLYVYVIPVVTVIFSAIILNETPGWKMFAGTALVLAGLFISAGKRGKEHG